MTKVEKFTIPFESKAGVKAEVMAEIRHEGDDTVVILTQPDKPKLKLHESYYSVAVKLLRGGHFEGREPSRVKLVIHTPKISGVPACYLVQVSKEHGSEYGEAFFLCEGMLPEGVVPMPRDGSQCNVTLHV